jgi:TusA-related sulfurtransferase
MFGPARRGMLGRMDETTAPANRFVTALAARDLDGLAATLASDARLRYLVPPGPGEMTGAAQVAAKFRQWFGDADTLEVQSVRLEPLPGRVSARYRFKVHNQQGWEVIEQQTFMDVDEDGRIAGIDLICSGFRPTTGPGVVPSTGVHRFDAGTLGCADGLAQEFRRRILAIPPGDVLVVQTSDPAAKEDLPPLARMMGHTVRSVEPSGNGRLLITVERGR